MAYWFPKFLRFWFATIVFASVQAIFMHQSYYVNDPNIFKELLPQFATVAFFFPFLVSSPVIALLLCLGKWTAERVECRIKSPLAKYLRINHPAAVLVWNLMLAMLVTAFMGWHIHAHSTCPIWQVKIVLIGFAGALFLFLEICFHFFPEK